jgi:hypothetical protein
METSELEAGQITDALVALAQGWELIDFPGDGAMYWDDPNGSSIELEYKYTPSTTGKAQCFELIEKFQFTVEFVPAIGWRCALDFIDEPQVEIVGCSTPALAICKAVIASKWGDMIPDEMWEKVK